MSMHANDPTMRSRAGRRRKDKAFNWFCMGAAGLSIVILFILLTAIFLQGYAHLDWDFITSSPSRKPENAGIYPAMIGSIYLMMVVAATAIPIGVATAVLLEEFKPRNRWLQRLHGFIQLNIANLAGVPSIVYGILGLTVIVNAYGAFGSALEPIYTIGTPDDWYFLKLPFGRSVLAGGLTLMLVVLPVVIVSAQEALRAVPDSLRRGSLALGATRWQTVWNITLPASIGGIMTGTILALSRAIGEAAPVLVIAGVVYITFTPVHLMDDFTAMPLQIFDWASRPRVEFHQVAAAGILVLLAVLLTFNAIAVFIRYKFQRSL
jgi:phosphate transport system permease protein